jgi:hypothetical protein
MLSPETVEGTEVVLLRAEGPQRQFLTLLVNTLTSVAGGLYAFRSVPAAPEDRADRAGSSGSQDIAGAA